MWERWDYLWTYLFGCMTLFSLHVGKCIQNVLCGDYMWKRWDYVWTYLVGCILLFGYILLFVLHVGK